MQLDPLQIVLVVLVLAAVWAVVELALTLRHARASVDEVTRTANETIEQAQPVIAKLDGVMDDLQPAIKQVDPLVERVGDAVDSANESLGRVNGILGDVSSVSSTAADVTDMVNGVATSAAAGVTNVINRISGKDGGAGRHAARLRGEGASVEDVDAQGGGGQPAHTVRYVTYGQDTGGQAPHAAASSDTDASTDPTKSQA